MALHKKSKIKMTDKNAKIFISLYILPESGQTLKRTFMPVQKHVAPRL
jgi:hypothetical protein